MNNEQLKKQLEVHEGIELHSYLCPAGRLTVGVGHNLEADPAVEVLGRRIDRLGEEISTEEAMRLLDLDIAKFERQVEREIPAYAALSDPRQHVLIDMAFNMGTAGLLKFKNMLAAVDDGNYTRAAEEMLDSRWARQVKTRATTLAAMMRENVEFSQIG